MAADLIILNAAAHTMHLARPRAEAVVVADERIAHVGTTRDALALASSHTRVVDAGGASLLPGLTDCHYHLLRGSLRLDGMELASAATFAELAEIVRVYAASHPDDSWLAGSGLRYQTLVGRSGPARAHLDALVADRPLVLLAFDGHTAWANTRALELAGLLGGGACGPNSEIVMAANGLAEGELREPGAFGPLLGLVPPPTAARARELLRLGIAQANRLGLTAVHNMDGDLAQLHKYQALEAAGDLTLRVLVPFDITPHTSFADLAEAEAMRTAASSSLVRAGCVKFFMDGVVEGYTGLLLEPYATRPDTCGDANYSAEHFAALATACDRRGLQIVVHAIGDAAVQRTLDGMATARAANSPRDSRHRVEHIEIIHPDDVPRFAELGVIASMQPHHAPVPPDYGPVWLAHVGEGRWPHSFAWRTLRDAGARLVFGSDWPVVSQNPLLGLAAAVARRPWLPGAPPQALSLDDALAAYTRDAAIAEFREHERGVLRPGMLADLTLFSHDLGALRPDSLTHARVVLTIVGGRVVFEG